MRNLKHKFFAKRTCIDNVKFASKLEGNCYQLLKSLKNAGEILFFLMQVPIPIGGGHRYVCDYLVFTKDECFFIEVKGKMLSEAKLKIDLASEVLGVQIHVVHKPEEMLAIIFPIC